MNINDYYKMSEDDQKKFRKNNPLLFVGECIVSFDQETIISEKELFNKLENKLLKLFNRDSSN
jgi:hypothetical protein